MLSDAELASMRADAEASLPDTCTILRPLRSRDSRGGDDEPQGEATVAAGVACLLAPTQVTITGTESGGMYGPNAGRGFTLDTTASVWRLVVPHGTDLREDYFVRLTSGPASGKRFEVVSLEDALGYATLLGAKVVRAGVSQE
jgi:hypothetical protein